MMRLDHLAVTCADLGAGVAWVEAALGVRLEPGGQHAHYATHNRLLGLGAGLYLEVIAPDPEAPAPGHPRWFGLDQAGAPRLGNWIVAVDDLGAALADAPEAGRAVALTRGALSWQIGVPDDGGLPLGGAFPTLIAWGQGVAHPSTRLADQGVRLTALQVKHPQAAALRGRLAALDDPRVALAEGPVGLRATFATPTGQAVLG
ncbi:MAG: VOC family protein [Rhodobacterales bacterium]|nr:VOC family protein [Rhodobacterales bacterium]NCT13224.1 VOC family protein [Rhodobacterales bacterium]